MSDEPSPLRLKPRLKPEGVPADPAPPAPAPAGPVSGSSPVVPPAPTDAEPVKIRLRPKLTSAEPSAPAASAPPATPPVPPESASPAEEKPRLKPRLAVESAAKAEPSPAPAAAAPAEVVAPTPPPAIVSPVPSTGSAPAEPGKFKLKPKGPEPAPTMPVVSAAPVPAPPPAVAEGLPPAPEGAAEPLPTGVTGEPAKPKIPHVRAPEGVDEAPAPLPIPPAPRRRRFSPKMLGALAALGVIVVCAIIFVLSRFLSPPPPPPPVVRKAVVPKKAPPAATNVTPPAAGAVSVPGKMVEKAKSVVAGHEKELVRPVAGVSGEEATSGNLTTPATKPPALTATTPIAPGLTATTSDLNSTVDASPAFRSWVANAKISGIFQGATPRALINGRTVRVGQMVDEGLGAVFEGINSETKEIIFKDKTGATVSRRY